MPCESCCVTYVLAGWPASWSLVMFVEGLELMKTDNESLINSGLRAGHQSLLSATPAPPSNEPHFSPDTRFHHQYVTFTRPSKMHVPGMCFESSRWRRSLQSRHISTTDFPSSKQQPAREKT